jgi:cell wall-associated NlpC family hydrolase
MITRWITLIALIPLGGTAQADEEPRSEGRAAYAYVLAAVPADGHFAAARELVGQAMSFLGVNYRYGGDSPERGFDCSGLVRHVVERTLGRVLPRHAREMAQVGSAVPRGELAPGDLVFFNTLRRPYSHVGIYLGDKRFIHAAGRGGAVRVSDMGLPYWQRRYNGARRLELQTGT